MLSKDKIISILSNLFMNYNFWCFSVRFCKELESFIDNESKITLYKLIDLIYNLDLDFSTMLESDNINERIIACLAYLAYATDNELMDTLKDDLTYYGINL